MPRQNVLFTPFFAGLLCLPLNAWSVEKQGSADQSKAVQEKTASQPVPVQSPAAAGKEGVAEASAVTHPLQVQYDGETNPFISSNWDRYGFNHKEMALQHFLAFAKRHFETPMVKLNREIGNANVDAARERLKVDLEDAIHFADWALRGSTDPNDEGPVVHGQVENARITEKTFRLVRPKLHDLSGQIAKDVKIVESYVKSAAKPEEDWDLTKYTRSVPPKAPGVLNPTRMAAALVGRTYHKLVYIDWNKQKGEAIEYIDNGGYYITHKPLIAKEDNGEVLARVKIQHIRRYVRDDYADLDMKLGKNGQILAARVGITIEGKEPFDSGLVSASANDDKVKANNEISDEIQERVKAYMAKFSAQGSRKNFANVIKQNMISLAGGIGG